MSVAYIIYFLHLQKAEVVSNSTTSQKPSENCMKKATGKPEKELKSFLIVNAVIKKMNITDKPLNMKTKIYIQCIFSEFSTSGMSVDEVAKYIREGVAEMEP